MYLDPKTRMRSIMRDFSRSRHGFTGKISSATASFAFKHLYFGFYDRTMNKPSIFLFSGLMLICTQSYGLSPLERSQANIGDLTSAQSERDNAPEAIQIKVGTVRYKRLSSARSDFCDQRMQLTADASIESVTRTATDLKPGDEIIINYVVTEMVCPNIPEETIPRISKHISYPAFLNCTNKTCDVAAGAWSFMSDETFSQELERYQTERNWWQME